MPVSARFHHIGMTVSNLEKSLEFYRDVFGLEPGMTFRIQAGPTTAAALGLPEHVQRTVLIPVGNVVLELLEITPRRHEFDGRQDDIGYAYPCFEVDDLDEVYRTLTAKGYEIHAEPSVTGGDSAVAGSKFCVLKDPDGKNIELIQTGPGFTLEVLRAGVAAGASLDAPIVLG
jgi:catechol 2,3-dioxygenase-like lactoylglutathione lyase family enzyme